MTRRGSASRLFLCSSFLHFSFSLPPLWLFLLVILNFIFLSSSLGESVFPFLWLYCILISGRDVLFWKFSIFGYSLPFSSLYLGYSSIFVSIKVLHSHFSSCSYALLVCVHPQTAGLCCIPACVFLSIPPLVAHICCTPFLCI